MTFKLVFKEDAKKEWDKLDTTIRSLFAKKLKERIQQPHIESTRLSGMKDCYKIKLRRAGYRQWQEQNGQLPVKKRLLPKIPFVVGGEFVLDNLHLVDAVEGMKFRADIASQIKDLPDGAQIKFDIIGQPNALQAQSCLSLIPRFGFLSAKSLPCSRIVQVCA